MNENSTVKELLNQCNNTKHFVDEIMKAYVGLTVDELIRLKGGERDEERTAGECT